MSQQNQTLFQSNASQCPKSIIHLEGNIVGPVQNKENDFDPAGQVGVEEMWRGISNFYRTNYSQKSQTNAHKSGLTKERNAHNHWDQNVD